MLGMHGVKSANFAVNECDTLFLIGARVGDRAVRTPLALEKTTKIIHIDIDPAEIGKNIGVDYPLVGDAKVVLRQLLEIAEPAKHTEWISRLSDKCTEKSFAEAADGTVNPREFIDRLSAEMPDNSVICADVGQNQIWTCTGYKFSDGGRLITAGGMGTMGYSVPAAIGAKLADPDRPVVAVCGDGSFQMQMMELATAVQHGVNIKVIVMTNTRLGMVRELQTNGYDDRQTAVFLDGSPDFIKLAEAYGIPAMRVDGRDSMEAAVKHLAQDDKLMLVEVVVDKDFATL
jgi:acetolactate synthase-1/2/3 large subunit